MELKPGAKLRSAVCDAQFIVVRAPAVGIDLACGGAPLLGPDDAPIDQAIDVDLSDGTLIGKRYADEDLGLELLCTRGGAGTLTGNGEPLALKGAKPLPSSD